MSKNIPGSCKSYPHCSKHYKPMAHNELVIFVLFYKNSLDIT